MNSALRARVGVVVCLLVGTALRFWRLGAAPLIGDEAYYWLWSRHLDWAYLDHPAGIALLIRVSTWLGGEGELGIRWLNALFGVALIPLAYALIHRLASPFAATLAAAIVALAPPLIVVSRWVYTDTLLLLLLMTHLLVLAPLLAEASGSSSHMHSPKRYVILAVLTALLMNTKYTVALYLGGVALVTLADPRLRRDGRLWLALGLGCLGAAPVVAWNLTHGWLSFRWQFAHLVHGSGHVASRLGAIAHLIRYLTPPVCLLAAIGIGAWADTGPHRRFMRRLVFLGLLLVLPAVLSPANSPRNTIAGVTLLLLASAATIDRWRLRAMPNAATAVSAAFLLLMAAYALGTVWAGLAPTSLPRSVIADALRRETLGWRGVRLDPAPPTTEELLLTIDYDLAGKLRYYGGYAAHTPWPQYRLWGIPDLPDVQIVAFDYVDPSTITARLERSFKIVEGPTLASTNSGPRLLRWRARGRIVDMDMLLDWLDYRALTAEVKP